VDAAGGQAGGEGEAGGEHHARKNSADQPRARRRGDGGELAQGGAGGGQRRLRRDVEPLGMRARSYLWHDSAEGLVQGGLIDDVAGEDLAWSHRLSVFDADADHRRSGVVAAGFEREDLQRDVHEGRHVHFG